jgi:hypothetical protein
MRAAAHSTGQPSRYPDEAPLPGWESFPTDNRQQVIQWIVQLARRQLPDTAEPATRADGR